MMSVHIFSYACPRCGLLDGEAIDGLMKNVFLAKGITCKEKSLSPLTLILVGKFNKHCIIVEKKPRLAGLGINRASFSSIISRVCKLRFPAAIFLSRNILP